MPCPHQGVWQQHHNDDEACTYFNNLATQQPWTIQRQQQTLAPIWLGLRLATSWSKDMLELLQVLWEHEVCLLQDVPMPPSSRCRGSSSIIDALSITNVLAIYSTAESQSVMPCKYSGELHTFRLCSTFILPIEEFPNLIVLQTYWAIATLRKQAS